MKPLNGSHFEFVTYHGNPFLSGPKSVVPFGISDKHTLAPLEFFSQASLSNRPQSLLYHLGYENNLRKNMWTSWGFFCPHIDAHVRCTISDIRASCYGCVHILVFLALASSCPNSIVHVSIFILPVFDVKKSPLLHVRYVVPFLRSFFVTIYGFTFLKSTVRKYF